MGVASGTRRPNATRGAKGHRQDRPATEWLCVEADALRIVPEPLCVAAHGQLAGRRAGYVGVQAGPRSDCRDGRGVRRHYFLTGHGRCSQCGGLMQAVSRASSAGRNFRYVCATYWNRGASVCANGRMVEMLVADSAVRDLLANEVLRQSIIERALDRALAVIQRTRTGGGRDERPSSAAWRPSTCPSDTAPSLPPRGGVP